MKPYLVSALLCSMLASAGATATATAAPRPRPPAEPAFITVIGKIPGMTPADSFDLGKVKTALDQATPDMWYSVGACPATQRGFYFVATPPGPRGEQDPDAIGVEDTIGTAEHPYDMVWTRMGTVRLGLRMPAIAPGTPLLVWEASDEGYLVVVTPDGGRYRVDGRPYSGHVYKFDCGNDRPMVAHGIAAAGALPPPLQSFVLTSLQIKRLEDAGQLPAGLSAKIEAARAAASSCTDKLWSSRFDARDKANVVANITESTRANRRAQILEDYNTAVPKSCAAQKKQFDAAFEAALTEYKHRRLDLYKSEADKLAALGQPNTRP